jgi:hypothetical protein
MAPLLGVCTPVAGGGNEMSDYNHQRHRRYAVEGLLQAVFLNDLDLKYPGIRID